jgi:hypothetical protein
VRVLRSAPDDVPTLQLTLLETSLATIQTTFGVTVTQTATEGSFVINSNTARTSGRLMFDVVDGAELIRGYAPKAVVASIGEINLTSTDAVGYELTFDLQFDQTLGGNVKVLGHRSQELTTPWPVVARATGQGLYSTRAPPAHTRGPTAHGLQDEHSGPHVRH